MFSRSDIALIARRSRNGRRATSYATSEWARKLPPARFLSEEDEAVILAYRWRTRVALNDAYSRLRRLMPKLTRSTLHRCLKRHGLSRIGSTATCPPLTAAALNGPYIFEITAHEVTLLDPDHGIGVLYPVLLAVEETTKDVYAEVSQPTPEKAAAFLGRLVYQFPQNIHAVAPDIDPAFTDCRSSFDEDEDMAAVSPHPFAVACRTHRIVHARSLRPHKKSPKTARRRNPVTVD